MVNLSYINWIFFTSIKSSFFFSPDNKHLTMRGNSIGTKAMEAYMKLVGEKVSTVIRNNQYQRKS